MSEVATVFKHEPCADCVYLGPFGDESTVDRDLWFCPQSGIRTVMGRWGDEPEQYDSGWQHSQPWAQEARRRAIARGLTEPEAGAGSETNRGER